MCSRIEFVDLMIQWDASPLYTQLDRYGISEELASEKLSASAYPMQLEFQQVESSDEFCKCFTGDGSKGIGCGDQVGILGDNEIALVADEVRVGMEEARGRGESVRIKKGRDLRDGMLRDMHVERGKCEMDRRTSQRWGASWSSWGTEYSFSK